MPTANTRRVTPDRIVAADPSMHTCSACAHDRRRHFPFAGSAKGKKGSRATRDNGARTLAAGSAVLRAALLLSMRYSSALPALTDRRRFSPGRF
jgi:hypothetical protein